MVSPITEHGIHHRDSRTRRRMPRRMAGTYGGAGFEAKNRHR
jgi:hypothetical protein